MRQSARQQALSLTDVPDVHHTATGFAIRPRNQVVKSKLLSQEQEIGQCLRATKVEVPTKWYNYVVPRCPTVLRNILGEEVDTEKGHTGRGPCTNRPQASSRETIATRPRRGYKSDLLDRLVPRGSPPVPVVRGQRVLEADREEAANAHTTRPRLPGLSHQADLHAEAKMHQLREARGPPTTAPPTLYGTCQMRQLLWACACRPPRLPSEADQEVRENRPPDQERAQKPHAKQASRCTIAARGRLTSLPPRHPKQAATRSTVLPARPRRAYSRGTKRQMNSPPRGSTPTPTVDPGPGPVPNLPYLPDTAEPGRRPRRSTQKINYTSNQYEYLDQDEDMDNE